MLRLLFLIMYWKVIHEKHRGERCRQGGEQPPTRHDNLHASALESSCLLPMEISWITHSMILRCLLATSVVVWQKCCHLPNGTDCLYLRARSNSENGETMTFCYRNKNTGEVKIVENVNFAFSSNASLGMPSSPYEVKIVFYHDVTITAGEGGTVNEKGGRLAEGSTLSLSATPAEGHHFVQWSDGSTDNPRNLTVGTEDITLAAEFALSSFSLTYTLDGANYKTTDVLYGTTLTPEPNPEKEGYTFSGWQGLPETRPAHDVEIHGTTTIIDGLEAIFANGDTRVTIYSINGVLLFHNTTVKEAAQHLKSGIYIVNGRKMVVK